MKKTELFQQKIKQNGTPNKRYSNRLPYISKRTNLTLRKKNLKIYQSRSGCSSPVNSSHSMDATFNPNKFTLNLERLQLIEEKLSEILEYLEAGKEVSESIKDYWNKSNDGNILELDKFFLEKRSKKAVKDSLVIESFCITLLSYLLKSSFSLSVVLPVLKQVLKYAHQNLLLLIECVLQNLTSEVFRNVWANSLSTTVRLKKWKKNTKKDNIHLIKQHTLVQISLIKRIIPNVPKSGFTPEYLELVLSKTSVKLARKSMLEILTMSLQKQFASTPTPPYLPSPSKPYTLVLDLDETLVHYNHQEGLLLRPGCRKFLKEMALYYEIVVFTAATEDYADWAINILDNDKLIRHRLYRKHTLPNEGTYIKDLNRLGRDLSKVIVVDNVAANFRLQTENGIMIRTWTGDQEDKAFDELMPVLLQIAKSEFKDLRVALASLKTQINKNLRLGLKDPLSNISLNMD